MRFARPENEGIARDDRRVSAFIAGQPGAGDHVVEFPLRRMRMIRIRRPSRRNPQDLDHKRMAVARTRRIRIPTEGFGNLPARAREFSSGRDPRELLTGRRDSAAEGAAEVPGAATPAPNAHSGGWW